MTKDYTLPEQDTRELEVINSLVFKLREGLNELGDNGRRRVWTYLKAKFDPEIFPALSTFSDSVSNTLSPIQTSSTVYTAPVRKPHPSNQFPVLPLEDDE